MSTSGKTRLYRTERTLTRTLRVAYPAGRGRMVLRTEQDWDRDLEPVSVSDDGTISTFELEVGSAVPLLQAVPRRRAGRRTGRSVRTSSRS